MYCLNENCNCLPASLQASSAPLPKQSIQRASLAGQRNEELGGGLHLGTPARGCLPRAAVDVQANHRSVPKGNGVGHLSVCGHIFALVTLLAPSQSGQGAFYLTEESPQENRLGSKNVFFPSLGQGVNEVVFRWILNIPSTGLLLRREEIPHLGRQTRDGVAAEGQAP